MKKYSFLALVLGTFLGLSACKSPSGENSSSPRYSMPQADSQITSQQGSKTGTANDEISNTSSAQVSLDAARSLALSQVPGATPEQIHIEGGYDDGLVFYKGRILYHDKEYDFKINGYTGEIMEWETEPSHG